MGIITTSASNAVASTFNSVSTTATTFDKLISSAYHGADALEANSKAYARRTKITLAEQEDALLEEKRSAMSAERAAHDIQLEERFDANPKLRERYEFHMNRIKSVQANATK